MDTPNRRRRLLVVTSALGGVGLALGAEGDIAAYMISRYFPKHSYGRVLGFVYFLFAMGSATGVFILGQVYGFTGSYGAGIVPIVAMVVVAIVCLLGMGGYRYSLDHRELADDESDPGPGADAESVRDDASEARR